MSTIAVATHGWSGVACRRARTCSRSARCCRRMAAACCSRRRMASAPASGSWSICVPVPTGAGLRHAGDRRASRRPRNACPQVSNLGSAKADTADLEVRFPRCADFPESRYACAKAYFGFDVPERTLRLHTSPHVIASTPSGDDNADSSRGFHLDIAAQGPVTAAQLRQLCARFVKPHFGQAVWQLINTLVPFAALWALMAWSVVGEWGYVWTLLLALPAAGLYVRTFIIQHDCGHGSYFASQRMNDLVGRCLGLATLFPYGYW